MFKVIITLFIVFILIRIVWRIMYPRRPHLPLPLELKACAHCGEVIPVYNGVKSKQSFFCSNEHAAQFEQAKSPPSKHHQL